MAFKAEQYSQIAEGYAKASTDPALPPPSREEFAKKAEWFRFLARRGTTTRPSESVEPSERTRRSIGPFITSLWLIGAAVYLISTLLFTDAVSHSGNDDRPAPTTTQAVDTAPKLLSLESNAAGDETERQAIPTAGRPHAISPDQPSYESPALTIPLPEDELNSTHPSTSSTQDQIAVPVAEVLTTTASATIRNGPSTTAEKIGTANEGAELQVKDREADWIQFVDPRSGNSGWIHSSLTSPSPGREPDSLAASQALENPNAELPKTNPARARLKPKAPAPAKLTKRQKTYVDLPPDDEFASPKRRGPGILAKRRMRRDGLMALFPPE